MSTISNAVYEFLEFHLGIYDNPQKAQIVMSPDGSIDMSSPWPAELTNDEEKINLGYSDASVEKFVEDFHITSSDQLDRFTPSILLEQFNQGITEISCWFVEKGIECNLVFFKKGNQLFAKDDYNTIYEVNETLLTPQQYIAYSKPWFHLQFTHYND